MPGGWADSRRSHELPPNWRQLRDQAFARDGHRCTWVEHGERCSAPPDECDHVGDKHDHRLENLRSLCRPHHGARTSRQGNAARWRHRQHRPTPRHPGLS